MRGRRPNESCAHGDCDCDRGTMAPMTQLRISRALFAALAAAALAAACTRDLPVPSAAPCPNAVPTQGSACPRIGMICSYYTGCADPYPATCQADGTWQFD